MTCNGYSNYETWCVCLWIWNDEGSCNYWRQRAAYGNLTEELKEWAENVMPELIGMFSDLLVIAVRMVCWKEIAATFDMD